MSEIKTVLDQVVAVCDEKKASDIRAYDVQESSSVTEYVVVLSANNSVHCASLVTAVDEWISAYCRETQTDDFYEHPKLSGDAGSGWVVLDLNSIVFHVLTEELRSFYELDPLFEQRGPVSYF